MTTRGDIKNLFKTGDIPTGENFASFIDFAADLVGISDGDNNVPDKGLKLQVFSYDKTTYDAQEGIIQALSGYEKVLIVIPMPHSHEFPNSSFYYSAQTTAISESSFTVRVFEQNSGESWTNETDVKVVVIGY